MHIHSLVSLFTSKRSSTKIHISHGFALPTVLIVSTVMLIVLLAAVQSSISVNQSIGSQYTSKLGKAAADSGLAMAQACYTASGKIVNWTNVRLLKPNTDCTGADLFSCPTSSTDPACYVLVTPGYRTKFTVGLIDDGLLPTALVFDSQGIVEELRTTSQTPVNRTTFNVRAKMQGPAGVFSTY